MRCRWRANAEDPGTRADWLEIARQFQSMVAHAEHKEQILGWLDSTTSWDDRKRTG